MNVCYEVMWWGSGENDDEWEVMRKELYIKMGGSEYKDKAGR